LYAADSDADKALAYAKKAYEVPDSGAQYGYLYAKMQLLHGAESEALALFDKTYSRYPERIAPDELRSYMYLLADAGEAELVYCEACGFAADTEAATAVAAVGEGTVGELEKIHTPGAGSIADVATLLHVSKSATRKALALIDGDGRPTVCFVPGDHEMNDVKAHHAFGDYHLMSDEELASCSLVKGFIGPVGLPQGVRVCADASLRSSEWWLVGANEEDYHFLHARAGRDFSIGEWVDVITAKAKDRCPSCGAVLAGARGIEVSQVFQLGTKYSKSLGATFTDESGHERPFLMGCYGIGVSRTLAAIVEQHHDEHGIIWPVSVAPFEVEIIALDVDDELVWPVAQDIAEGLVRAGVEVVIDDRTERPGVKFKDSELLGMPYVVVLGRSFADGKVELRVRGDETEELPYGEVVARVSELARG